MTAAVISGVACGGSTNTPPDGADGSADAVHVARDAVGDLVVSDVLAKWQQVSVTNSFRPCPTSSCSTSWYVTPDGKVSKIRLGHARSVQDQMSPSDLSELDSIVSSQPFVDGMTNGFVCDDRPPTDVFAVLRLKRDGDIQTQDVTGCVFTGPMGNLPRRVNDLLTKY